MTYGSHQEIRQTVAVEVDGQTTQIARLIEAQYRLASLPAKGIDELQRQLVGGKAGNGRQIDLVLTTDKIHDPISCTRGRVAAGSKHEGIGTSSAPEFIAATSAINDVVAGAPFELIGHGIADQQVVTRTAKSILHGDTLGNGNIANHAADIRERGLIEVDFLVLGKPGEIQGIVAAAVPYRKHDFR
ncbi:hypothetical protein D3C77_391230 [compost metagenome]